MKKIITLFLVISMCSAGGASFATDDDRDAILGKLQQISWETWNEQGLKSIISSHDDVRILLDEFYGYDGAVDSVSDYQLIDLNGDNTYELIAATDSSGRGFYWNVVVLWKRGHKIDGEDIDGHDITDIATVVQDLDGDGQMELVMPTLIGEYQGAQTEPVIVPRIYAIQGAGYTEASRNFKRYYREVVIPQFQNRLEIAKSAKYTREVGILQKQLSECQRILNE